MASFHGVRSAGGTATTRWAGFSGCQARWKRLPAPGGKVMILGGFYIVLVFRCASMLWMKYSSVRARAACYGGGRRLVAAGDTARGGEVVRIEDAKQAGQAAELGVKIT